MSADKLRFSDFLYYYFSMLDIEIWKCVHFSVALSNVRFQCLQVKGLETGASYVFRVLAENAKGIGMASTPSDPVCVKALPGKHAM